MNCKTSGGFRRSAISLRRRLRFLQVLPQLLVLVLGALGGLFVGAFPASAATQILGAGSSFAGNEVQDWVAQTSSAPYSQSVNWTTSSSGDGRLKFSSQTIDFAVSDITYQTGEVPPSFPFIYVPVTAGGLAFMYNLPQLGSTTLQLSSYSACAIFEGAVTSWNDPIIQTDNPGVNLPNVKITPIYRTDGAGSNWVFEDYCQTEQPAEWTSFENNQTIINFNKGGAGVDPGSTPYSIWPGLPNGIAESSAESAADTVANTVGTITPVETSYAIERNMPTASVKNASGDYVQPTGVDADSALAYAKQQSNGYEVLNFNGTGPHVYNPSTYSYLLARTTGGDPTKGAAIAAFAYYALTVGQESQNIPGYGSLGLSLENYGVDQIQSDVPGARNVSLTAGEQNDFACGDLTIADVQAGKTTPGCSSTSGPSGSGSSSGGSGTSGAAGTSGTSAGKHTKAAPLPPGCPAGAYGTALSVTLGKGAARLTAGAGAASATVTVPAGALASGTTVSLAAVKAAAPLAGRLPKGHAFLTSFAVSWITGSGTVPAARAPLSIVITDAAIAVGDAVYQVVPAGVQLLGATTTARSVSIKFSKDPAFVLAGAAPATTPAKSATTATTVATATTVPANATTVTTTAPGPSAAVSLSATTPATSSTPTTTAPASVDPSSLSYTGFDPFPLLVFGGGVVVVSSLMLRHMRRRRLS